MRLQIGPNLDNNNVRLDFKRSPDIPSNAPSYEIQAHKADEFVKKYNKQEKNLMSGTLVSSLALATTSLILSLKRNSWLWAILGIPGGIFTGIGVGAMVSSHKKNDLMDKYNVKRMRKN